MNAHSQPEDGPSVSVRAHDTAAPETTPALPPAPAVVPFVAGAGGRHAPAKLTESQRDRAERNIPLAMFQCRGWVARNPAREDDIKATALYGLCRGVDAFDKSEKANPDWPGTCRSYVRRELVGWAQQERPRGFRKCLPDARPRHEPLPGSADRHPADARRDPRRDVEDADAFEAMLVGLTGRQQTILRLRFRDDLEVSEIAARLGIERTTVWRDAKAALAAIRARFGTDPRLPS